MTVNVVDAESLHVMSETITVPWKSVEKWDSVAFGVAGMSWLVLMAIVALPMASGASTPAWLIPLFLVTGLLASYLGLLGIYPHIKEVAPRMSLAGVGAVVIAAALVVFAVSYTVVTGTVDEGPPFPVFPLMLVSTILGFLLIGTASVRTDNPTRWTGILVLVPAVAWFGDIVFIIASRALGVREIAGVSLQVLPMVGVVLASLALVALGYHLQTQSQSRMTDQPESAPDSTG